MDTWISAVVMVHRPVWPVAEAALLPKPESKQASPSIGWAPFYKTFLAVIS
jgi:hypothetical protein